MYFFNVLLNHQNPPLAATAIAAKQFFDFLIFFWISRFFLEVTTTSCPIAIAVTSFENLN